MKPVVTSIFSILFFAFISSAQDEPCSALQLDCNQPALTVSFAGLTVNPEYPFPPCGVGNFNHTTDIWFSFESDGIQTSLFYSDTVSFFQGSPKHQIKLYSGEDCENISVVCDCTLDEVFHEVLNAGTYYVQVRGELNNSQNYQYSAGLRCLPPPANDDICSATSISCGETVQGTLLGATADRTDDCTSTAGCDKGGDVWFNFEADGNSVFNIFDSGSGSTELYVYQADDCSDELIQVTPCDAQNLDALYLDEPGNYYIRVRPENYQVRKAIKYTLNLECSPLPENSLPCDATPLSCDGNPIEGSTSGASADVGLCDVFGLAPQVWYKYTSDIEGTLELYLCSVSPSFNATSSVYTGSCESLSCYASGGGCIAGPTTFDVSPGQDYFIAVHGFGGSEIGDFTLTLQCEEEDFCPNLDGFVGDPCDDGNFLTENTVITADCECIGNPIPPGALCENAIPITQNSFFVDYFNPSEFIDPPYYYEFDDIPAFLDSLDSDDVSFDCYRANGVVFSFTPDEDRLVDITVGNWVEVEPNITILMGCPFTTAHISKGCDGDNFETKRIEDFYALADTTYYILIDGSPDVFGPFDVRFQMEVDFKKICPELGVQFEPCDDGDPLTENDIITGNCTCEGTIPDTFFCQDPLEIIPGPGLTASPILFDASDAVPSPLGYCDGSTEERQDSWFSYQAVSTSMAIGVKGVGDYDAVLEVYDACGGNRIKCRNGGEEGGRETVLVSNSVIGQEYLYRVYERGGNPLNFNSFRTSVTFFPSADIEQADCDQGVFTTSDILTATIPEFEYSVSKWTWQFTELESPFESYEVVSPNGSNPNFSLSQFPQIEEGRSYSVRVKPSYLNLEIDGDYGEACEISVVESNGIGALPSEANWADDVYTFDIFPNPNDGSEVNITLSSLAKGQNTVQLRIYDFVGKLVVNDQVSSEGEVMNFRLPIVDLADGIYIVKLNVNDKPLDAKKLVIR